MFLHHEACFSNSYSWDASVRTLLCSFLKAHCNSVTEQLDGLAGLKTLEGRREGIFWEEVPTLLSNGRFIGTICCCAIVAALLIFCFQTWQLAFSLPFQLRGDCESTCPELLSNLGLLEFVSLKLFCCKSAKVKDHLHIFESLTFTFQNLWCEHFRAGLLLRFDQFYKDLEMLFLSQNVKSHKN